MSEDERMLGTREPEAAHPPASPAAEPTRAREHLANERTLLAWTRTSLTLIGVGFVVARFGLFLRTLESPGTPVARFSVSALIGIAAIVAGLVAGGAALVRFARARGQIEAGAYRAEYWPEALLMVMVGLLGVALAVYLAVNG
jgi:putative membrane protein